MIRRTTPELRMPENGQGLASITAPGSAALQMNALESDIAKVHEFVDAPRASMVVDGAKREIGLVVAGPTTKSVPQRFGGAITFVHT